jgi:hypothetical protein
MADREVVDLFASEAQAEHKTIAARRERYRQSLGIDIDDPDRTLIALLQNIQQLNDALRRGRLEKRMIVGLITGELSNAQLTPLLGCSSGFLAAVRRPGKQDDAVLPGMAMDADRDAVHDRLCTVTGRRFSEERAEAAAFYQRPENAEPRSWTDRQGRVHVELIGKKTITQIYSEYVQERAGGDESKAPLGRTAFYEARPPNFHARSIESCVCAICKHGAAKVKAMREAITHCKDKNKANEALHAAWARVHEQHTAIAQHITNEVAYQAISGAHPLRAGARLPERWSARTDPLWKQTNDQIEAALTSAELPKNGRKEDKIERLRTYEQRMSPGECAQCNVLYDVFDQTSAGLSDPHSAITTIDIDGQKLSKQQWQGEWLPGKHAAGVGRAGT